MSSTYAPLLTATPGSGAELNPGSYLLQEHCSQFLLVEGSAQGDTPEHQTSLSTITALELAQLINEPGEIINASYPRLSALFTDAQLSMTEKRIDDLYSQLQQVSEVLQQLISDLMPSADPTVTEGVATSVATSEPDGLQDQGPEQADLVNEPEPLRAMAMAA